MNWIEVISIILGSGGVGGFVTFLFTAKYKRRAAQLENEKNALVNEAQNIKNHTAELDRWKDLHDRALMNAEKVEVRYDKMVGRKTTELETKDKEIADLKVEISQKDKKIDSLYEMHSKDREIIDALRSENTALSIFRCDKVDCVDRTPPFAYQIPALALTETLKAQSNG